MDGYAVTRKLRELLPADQQPWIVALTAEAMEGVREKCLAVGMNDYLSKPVRGQDLADALNRYVMAQNVKTSLAEFPRMNTETLNELQELKHSAGHSLFDEMVELFLTETPRRLKELRAAIAAGELETIHRAAHAQKGASANLGAEGMADLCRELEKTTGDKVEALRLFALLEQEFVRVEKYFRSSLRADAPVTTG
jgi:HPt (histidine-containing phosphotransfer) domain-containing protein